MIEKRIQSGDLRSSGDASHRGTVSAVLRQTLDARCAAWVRFALWLVACAVFYAFAMHARYARIDEFAAYGVTRMTRITALAFTAIFAVSFAVQLHMGRRLSLGVQMLLALVTGAVLLGKISLLDYVSDDYDIFLSNWIYSYSQMSIREGLGTYIGSDYTPPYLYLLLLISRVRNFPWQYLVKAVSILAEVPMCWAIAQLVGLSGKKDGTKLFFYHAASLLPTVVFNGAYWGQCDAIYVALCLAALYCGMTKRSAGCMILFGAALSFKLQTVFFLPALLVLWLRREIKLRHLPLIPAAYMAMMLPALWGGKSLHHVLTVYLTQAGGYNFITINAPTLYQFLPSGVDGGTLYTLFGGMAMALGMAALIAACALVCMRRNGITRQSELLFVLLVLASVPFFLPKMHERYTFGADVLALALTAYASGNAALPVLFGLASYICYTAGLPGENLMDLRWASVFQACGIVLTAVALWRSLNGSGLIRPDEADLSQLRERMEVNV